MKQKNKSLALIALVLVVAALGAALVFLNGLEEEEDPGLPLFGLDAADITGISYQKADDEIDVTLLKQDGAWTLTSDPALPLDQDYVGTVGGNIAGLTAVRELDPGELSGEDLGFDQPAMVLHLALNGADPAATGESAADVYTLTVGAENTVTDACYAKASWTDRLYTIASEDLVNLCRTPRQLYEEQAITSLEEDDLTAMTVELPGETLDFRYDADAGAWTLADDPDYALDQNLVTKMAATVCALKSQWSITAPQADSAYGLDAPEAVVTLTGADGTSVTASFGATTPDDDSASYLRASTAPDVVYEIDADNLAAYAYTKATLQAATPETATGEDAAE